MNLIQQAEQLKSLPDQALVQMQQRPTETPPYLVLAEMQRRANMRKAYQGAQQVSPMNQPPVTQQMAQQFSQTGQTQQQPQQQMPQQVPGMAGGGLANFAQLLDRAAMNQMRGVPERAIDAAGLGLVDEMPLPDASGYGSMAGLPEDPNYTQLRGLKQKPYDGRTWEQHYEELANKSNLSGLKAVADKYAEQENDVRGRKHGLSQILMNIGLGMAASRRPDWAGAIGEGGLNAMQGYTQDRAQNQAMAERIAERRLRALESVQRHDDRLRDYAIEAARGDTARANTVSAQNANIDLAMWKAQQEKELLDARNRNEISLEEYKTAQSRLDAAARRAEKEADRAAEYKKATDVARIQAAARGERRGRGGDAPAKIDTGVISLTKEWNDTAESYEKQANDLFKNMILVPTAQRPMAEQQIVTLRQQAEALRKKAERMQDFLSGGRAQGQPTKTPTAPPANRKYTPEELLNMFKPRGQ